MHGYFLCKKKLKLASGKSNNVTRVDFPGMIYQLTHCYCYCCCYCFRFLHCGLLHKTKSDKELIGKEYSLPVPYCNCANF